MSLVGYGLGPMAPPLRFLMRAHRALPTPGFVYWEVEDAPDPTGTQAPLPVAQLSDIVTVCAYPQQTS